ncbi:TPA: TolC family protein [Providencia rettgeri]|uniref:TolC family protein n=1 Tax=Providencia TaxID=586 RepID=UPI0023492027|nr:TolC family protein [Providencia sp. PROV197]
MRKIYYTLAISMVIFSINHCFANSESFNLFIDKVLNNSTSVKIKELELEAEGYRAKQTEYFYLPKVSATSKIKNNKEPADGSLTATSLIYDSALMHRFSEKNLKLKISELALNKEKEELYTAVTGNLIGIHFLSELTKSTTKLHHNAQDIFNLINRRYNSGVAKISDVEQATLLMQRIETERKNIEKEIEQYKSNIEVISGITFPKEGVNIPSRLIKNLKSTFIDNDHTNQNIDYNMLKMQADAIKENAYQQNSLFSINLVAEEKYAEQKRSHNESYIGLDLKVNVFDIDKIFSESAQLKTYAAVQKKADYKYQELTAKIKNLKLISSSNQSELAGLQEQRNTMYSIIKSQEREYSISQSSFYEMVNTLFDILTIERRIAELTISDIKNKMEYIQLIGNINEIKKLHQ